MHSEANQRWKNPVEEFGQSNSYKELLGTDGEPIDFECNIFPGLTSLEISQKIRQQISSVSTEQSQAGVKSSLKRLRIKKSRLRKKFVTNENEPPLKNVKPQEVNSFVQTSNE